MLLRYFKVTNLQRLCMLRHEPFIENKDCYFYPQFKKKHKIPHCKTKSCCWLRSFTKCTFWLDVKFEATKYINIYIKSANALLVQPCWQLISLKHSPSIATKCCLISDSCLASCCLYSQQYLTEKRHVLPPHWMFVTAYEFCKTGMLAYLS